MGSAAAQKRFGTASYVSERFRLGSQLQLIPKNRVALSLSKRGFALNRQGMCGARSIYHHHFLGTGSSLILVASRQEQGGDRQG